MWATHFSHFCGNITMEICRLSTIVLLAIIATAILSDRISLDKHVKGYLGNDVKLGCKLLNGKLTQFQWLLVKPENTVTLLVHNPDHGLSIHETPLKGRLESAGTALDASITIKDVQMNDTGTYTCEVSSFPDGYFRGNVTLTVLDHPRPLSSGEVVGIVTAVLLFVLTLTVVAYIIIVRKREAFCNSRVGARGLVVNAERTERAVDLVYSDIASFRIAKNIDPKPSTDHQKHAEVNPDVDVIYAGVAVGKQHHVREDIIYHKVVKKDEDDDNDWIV
ncbi:nectin-3-like protein isoform X2 [Esox lucius]|uniref:nectin-3-like protein isoform X2 n=1 Tax=Esox lucius TaxID=8010 RepID=UPI001476DAC5|nr:nectin-3-like protein isoform X2 [Esox lucius]